MLKKLIFLASTFVLLLSGCSNFLNSKLSELPDFFQNSNVAPEISLEYLENGNVSILLKSDNLSGVYEIERAETINAEGEPEFISLAKNILVDRHGTIYVDRTTKPTVNGRTYWYKARLINGENTTDYSATKEKKTVLYAPTLSGIISGPTETTLSIKSPYNGSYTIKRATFNGVAGEYVLLESDFMATAGNTTYIDNTAYPTATGISYLYSVQLNFRGEKSVSVESEVTHTLSPPSLSVELTDKNEVTLNINSIYSGAYVIERASSSVNAYGELEYIILENEYNGEAGITTYVDSPLPYVLGGETYIYRVKLSSFGIESNYSNLSNVFVPDTTIVENFHISNKSTSDLVLSWDSNVLQAEHYQIFYNTDNNILTAQSVLIDSYFDSYQFSADGLVGYYFWIQPIYSDGKKGGISSSIFGMLDGVIEYSFNGSYTYTYKGSKPATVYAYLRGAGGGGQGGGGNANGGAGGAGAVTYVSFLLTPNSLLKLDVGLGGAGGSYDSGYYNNGDVGKSGEMTILTLGKFIVSANGGYGGGSSGFNYGGKGGAELDSIINPENVTVFEFLREAGLTGTNGAYYGNSQAKGGFSPVLKGFPSVETGGAGGAEAISSNFHIADGKNGKDGYVHLTISVD